MNEMMERVAKAAYEKFNENLIGDLEPHWADLERSFKERMIDAQKAAILAMREPTLEMIAATWHRESTDDIWKAMIDQALKETPDPGRVALGPNPSQKDILK